MKKPELLETLNNHLTFKEVEHMIIYRQRKDILQPKLTINIFGEPEQTLFIIITTPQKIETTRIKMYELQPHQ